MVDAYRDRHQEIPRRVRSLSVGETSTDDGGLMADGLINLTIDGAPVSVPPGTLVIEAAKQAGVLVPHYCYHPGLPVAGVCRMCLVEIEKAPKLPMACATTVTEGMVVKTQSVPAKDARQSVLEFLLINHPLDCPICDQAGECELQDFVFQEGQARTRYAEFAKRFNPVEDFGPDVLYVPNRCILCTRCVRFMEDVAKEPVLNVSERGDRAFIGIHPEARLDHPWAGNVVDLCPVGSLLSKDFLHKARAWELDKTASICTGCSQGCNVTLDTRENVIVRVRPRSNLEVNRFFICDHGRMNYRWMNRGDRIEAPLVRRGDEPDIAVRTAGALIYVGTVLPERARDAQAVLPIANVAEEEGTYVNRDGRVQRYFQAKSAPGMARPAWWVFSELVTALSGGPGGHVGTAAEAFDRLAASVEAFRGLSYAQLGFGGAPTPVATVVPA